MTDEFVTVATCSQRFEAEVIRGRLESEGIEAHVKSQGWADVYFGAGPTNVGGGVAVQVPEADSVRARSILDHPVELPDDDALWSMQCPACGSTDVTASAPSEGLLSIVMDLLPGDKDRAQDIAYTCNKCGRKWTEPQTEPGPAQELSPRLKDVRIRECAEGDVAAVTGLQVAWADENITYGYTASDESAIREAMGPLFLVAERRGKIMGYAIAALRASPGLAVLSGGETFVEIDDIYVAAGERGLGIGKELLAQTLARAKERGATMAMVYSATKDIRKITRFYTRQGFETWYVQMFKEL